MLTLTATTIPSCTVQRCPTVRSDAFPSFLPKEVHEIKDPFARKLASRIQRLPVSFGESCVMSSCVKPLVQSETSPVLLLHGFDSSCLEWRYTYPLLEEAGLETWAVDILGWGFSDLDFASLDSLICFGVLSFKYFNHSNVFVMCVTEKLPSCSVASKRDHLFQLWKSYIKKPMILVGPSLGASVAIDFAVSHPEAASAF